MTGSVTAGIATSATDGSVAPAAMASPSAVSARPAAVSAFMGRSYSGSRPAPSSSVVIVGYPSGVMRPGAVANTVRFVAVRVLIADDQALVRGGFRAILELQDGLEVVGEAGDGLAAIDLARRREPDVVLMDIQMPGVDGIEAARPDRRGVRGRRGADAHHLRPRRVRLRRAARRGQRVPAQGRRAGGAGRRGAGDRGRRRADRAGHHQAADRAVRAQRTGAGFRRRRSAS